MVTHDHGEALALADRVAVLMKGRIRQLGATDDVFSCPTDEDVASFVEAGNMWRGIVSSQKSGVAGITIGTREIQAASDLAPGTQVAVYSHYEDVTLSLSLPEPMSTSARNQLRGLILKVFPVGAQLKVTVDCGFPVSSLITRRSWDEMGLAVGREVVASFKASALHLIPKL
jgi:molybdopterin-binding protein